MLTRKVQFDFELTKAIEHFKKRTAENKIRFLELIKELKRQGRLTDEEYVQLMQQIGETPTE